MSRLYLASIACLLLSACQPTGVDIHNTYTQRLANVLQGAPTGITLKALYKPNIKLAGSNNALSILDLAHINHCQLASTIAQNNNQLGKLRVPSEKLKYQIAFIQQAPPCINHTLTNNDKIKSALNDEYRYKLNTISEYFNYMVFNERELSQFLHLSASEINLHDDSDKRTQTIEALHQLAKIRDNITSENRIDNIETSKITLSLAKLHKNKFIPRLLSSARWQIQLNVQATQWLNTFEISKDICPKNKNKQKATIIDTIFSQFYLKDLQPYQSKLVAMLHDVSPNLFVLWQNEPALKQLVELDNTDSLYMQLKLSAKEHVKWWQRFYKTCNISPF